MTDVVLQPDPLGAAAPRPGRAVRPASAAGSSLSYMPGLDGLRAVAVIAVFLFHGGVTAASGGYLAVSTFFTLSGFLITLLLFRELESRDRVAVGAFWERRVRRLLPAAALGVALAAFVTTMVGTPSQRHAFGTDGAATLLDVANWRFIVADTSYGQLFESPSALQHSWSLAVEAQFYWIYPLLFLGVMRVVGGDRRRFGMVLGALFIASIALARWGGFSADRIYYGTDTRAAELLAGAILGVVVVGRPMVLTGARWSGPRRQLSAVSVAAFVLLVGAWIATPQDAAWLGTGGLGVYALVSCVVVLGAAVPGTVLSGALAVGPFRMLGRISYGFYLFHWPVLLLLTNERVPGPAPVRLVVAGAVTVGLAALSYRYIEQPIRARSLPFRRVGLGGVIVMCGAVALIPSLVVARAAPPVDATETLAPGSLVSDTDDLGAPDRREVLAAPAESRAFESTASIPGAATDVGLQPASFVPPSRPLRLVVVGDSVAYRLAPLLDGWGDAQGVWSVASHARFGCGIVRGGYVHGVLGDNAYGPHCLTWPEEWAHMLAEVQPDVVVLAGGFWDAVDRRMVEGGPWQAPGDPGYDDLVLQEYDLALEVLTAAGTPVAWLDHPPIGENGSEAPVIDLLGYDPARMQRLDEIQDDAAARHPAARIVRTTAFLTSWPGGVLDEGLRPDGMHFHGPGASPFIDWLGPEIVNAYWSVTAGPPTG